MLLGCIPKFVGTSNALATVVSPVSVQMGWPIRLACHPQVRKMRSIIKSWTPINVRTFCFVMQMDNASNSVRVTAFGVITALLRSTASESTQNRDTSMMSSAAGKDDWANISGKTSRNIVGPNDGRIRNEPNTRPSMCTTLTTLQNFIPDLTFA